jgi:hypothetical protein
VTPVFDVPVTVAVNDCIPPVCTDAELGLIVTTTVCVPGGVLGFDADEPAVPAQPASPKAAIRTPRIPAVIHSGSAYLSDGPPYS